MGRELRVPVRRLNANLCVEPVLQWYRAYGRPSLIGMAGMHASPDDLRATATWIVDQANELDDELTKVNRALTDLLGDGWQGRAASSHEDGWLEWARVRPTLLPHCAVRRTCCTATPTPTRGKKTRPARR